MNNPRPKEEKDPQKEWEGSWRPEDKAKEAVEQVERRKKHPEEEPEVRRNEKFIGPRDI